MNKNRQTAKKRKSTVKKKLKKNKLTRVVARQIKSLKKRYNRRNRKAKGVDHEPKITYKWVEKLLTHYNTIDRNYVPGDIVYLIKEQLQKTLHEHLTEWTMEREEELKIEFEEIEIYINSMEQNITNALEVREEADVTTEEPSKWPNISEDERTRLFSDIREKLEETKKDPRKFEAFYESLQVLSDRIYSFTGDDRNSVQNYIELMVECKLSPAANENRKARKNKSTNQKEEKKTDACRIAKMKSPITQKKKQSILDRLPRLRLPRLPIKSRKLPWVAVELE